MLLPGLLGWNINQNAETFLEFLVATHLATAIVLFVIYFKDWVRIVKGIFRSLARREISDADPDAKLGWLLVVSTIPAGIIGLLSKDRSPDGFSAASAAVLFDVERNIAPARRMAAQARGGKSRRGGVNDGEFAK